MILATELSQGKPVAGIGAAAADGMLRAAKRKNWLWRIYSSKPLHFVHDWQVFLIDWVSSTVCIPLENESLKG